VLAGVTRGSCSSGCVLKARRSGSLTRRHRPASAWPALGGGLEPLSGGRPSKTTHPAGQRVETDRRDALHLAKLMLLGELSAVRAPTSAEEAARGLMRAREDARTDLMRARRRLSPRCCCCARAASGGALPGRKRTSAGFSVSAARSAACRFVYEEGLAAMAAVRGRRVALGAAPARRPPPNPWGRRGAPRLSARVSTLTAFGPSGLATGIASLGARTAPTSARCPARGPPANAPGRRQSPRRAAVTPTGRSSSGLAPLPAAVALAGARTSS